MQTPILLIDRSKILDNYREMQSAFPDFCIAYAMKSNSHDNILKMLLNEHAYIETASIQEVDHLLKLGFKADKIIFSNPVKPDAAIKKAVSKGVEVMSFDSLDELKKFKPWKDKIKGLLRIDVPNDGSLWTLNGKFGCPRRIWPDIYQYMQENEMDLAGITFHVGSQCERAQTWGAAIELAGEAVELARQYSLNPEILNIGGGFPIFLGRPIPAVRDIADVTFKALEVLKEKGIVFKKFYAEPGRYISGPAGTLATKVIGVCDRDVKGKSEKWVFLDTGVFSGLMETIDGITYPLFSNGSGEMETVMLCGPSCDGADKMFKASLPQPKVGDIIYMTGTGAYTTAYASSFNGIAPPHISFADTIENNNINVKSA